MKGSTIGEVRTGRVSIVVHPAIQPTNHPFIHPTILPTRTNDEPTNLMSISN